MDTALHMHHDLRNHPYKNVTRLFAAKVIASHPDKGTVDLASSASLAQGGIIHDVPVVTPSAGTLTGESYFPSVDLATPEAQPNTVYDQPLKSGKQDVWCVVGYLDGFAETPVCLGFIQPLISKARPSSVGMKSGLHESGIYQIITKGGHDEIHFPDGSYIIIATDSTPVDMTQENKDWSPSTTTTAYNVTLNIKGNVNITVAGDAVINASEVYLGTTKGNGKPIVRDGDSVSVDTSTGKGTVTSSTTKVYSG